MKGKMLLPLSCCSGTLAELLSLPDIINWAGLRSFLAVLASILTTVLFCMHRLVYAGDAIYENLHWKCKKKGKACVQVHAIHELNFWILKLCHICVIVIPFKFNSSLMKSWIQFNFFTFLCLFAFFGGCAFPGFTCVIVHSFYLDCITACSVCHIIHVCTHLKWHFLHPSFCAIALLL